MLQVCSYYLNKDMNDLTQKSVSIPNATGLFLLSKYYDNKARCGTSFNT